MTRARSPRSIAIVLAIFCIPLAAVAQKTPIGLEFQVNVFTLSDQRLPAVAADAEGDFVVAWDSANQDGYGFGLFARRFSSDGTPLAVEFQVNTYTTAGSRVPAVAVAASGDFVIVWRDGSGSIYDIKGRRFSSAGGALAGEFRVNTYTPGQQLNPVVTAGTAGDFVVVWFSDGQDGAGGGIFAQRFTDTGATNGGEFQVNTQTANYQRSPAIALDPTGAFVIAWQSQVQDGADWGVFAQRFSSAATPLGAEFQVNVHTVDYQGNPSAASNPNGDFVIAWESQHSGTFTILARRFSSAGTALAGELQVDMEFGTVKRLPSVAADAAGDFVVVWHNSGGPANAQEVRGRRFSSAGSPLTDAFQVNTYTPFGQRGAVVAAQSDSDFVVIWEDQAQDRDSYGVFGQRFAALPTLDVDSNGSLDAFTDGLLVVRYLFGFTGATLTDGATGPGCARCDATTIEPYLLGLGLLLDIDGNADLEALKDGLLVLRYQFGFTGAALTTGATGGGCSRCDATTIEPYLLGLSS